MNQINIVGKSGADAELRYTQTGKAVLNLSVCVSEKVGDVFEPNWFRVVLFGDLAERMKHIKKGMKLMVNGSIKNREYQDKNGNKQKSADLIARSVYEIAAYKPQVSSDHDSFSNYNKIAIPHHGTLNESDLGLQDDLDISFP